jgi:hypothetical protein
LALPLVLLLALLLARRLQSELARILWGLR